MKRQTSLKNVLIIILTIGIFLIPLISINPLADDLPTFDDYNGMWVNVTKEVFPTDIHPCEETTIGINVTVEGESIIKLPDSSVVASNVLFKNI